MRARRRSAALARMPPLAIDVAANFDGDRLMVFKAVFFLVGALSLLSLFADRRRLLWYRVGFLALAVAAPAYAIATRHFEESRKSFADVSTSRLVHQGILDLRAALADPGIRNVLIVDGGSYPARGLDGALLRALLEEASGRRYAVVQLSQGGANHFERYETYRLLLRELSAAEKRALKARDVSLWLEVQRGYDTMPMAQFNDSQRTDRTYAYLTLSNAAVAAWVEWKYSNAKSRWRKLPMLGAILAHGLGRQFRSPQGGWHSLSALPVQAGYSPLPGTAEQFRGMRDIAKRLAQPKRTRSAPWVDRVRTPRLKRLFRDTIDRIEYYSVPTPYPEYAAYARRFCIAHRRLPCMDYADPSLLAALDDREYWGDKGHLSRKGAERYTRWLAARYLTQRSVAGTPAPHADSGAAARRE